MGNLVLGHLEEGGSRVLCSHLLKPLKPFKAPSRAAGHCSVWNRAVAVLGMILQTAALPQVRAAPKRCEISRRNEGLQKFVRQT